MKNKKGCTRAALLCTLALLCHLSPSSYSPHTQWLALMRSWNSSASSQRQSCMWSLQR